MNQETREKVKFILDKDYPSFLENEGKHDDDAGISREKKFLVIEQPAAIMEAQDRGPATKMRTMKRRRTKTMTRKRMVQQGTRCETVRHAFNPQIANKRMYTHAQ